MTRECHVRFCEGLGVKFPRSTLQLRLPDALLRNVHVQGFRPNPPRFGDLQALEELAHHPEAVRDKPAGVSGMHALGNQFR